jgi:hypothetical protein
LPLQFFAGNAVPGNREQVHGVIPALQGRVRLFKRRSDHWVKMVATPLAGESLLSLEAVKLCMAMALWAIKFGAETLRHQMVKARIVIWKQLEKFLNGHWLGDNNLHDHRYSNSSTLCKGDNRVNNSTAGLRTKW